MNGIEFLMSKRDRIMENKKEASAVIGAGTEERIITEEEKEVIGKFAELPLEEAIELMKEEVKTASFVDALEKI